MNLAVIGFAAIGLVVVALIIYIVKEATLLKAATQGLQNELRQFKEGGFDRLVSDKLAILSQKSAQEIELREQLIKEQKTQLFEEERRTAQALTQLNADFGSIREQISTMPHLVNKLGELNDLLKPQQLRGELGEVIVRTLIADKLPRAQYEEDYVFPDGKKVEFAIRLNDKLIPIDSKLQLEDFKRMRDAEEKHKQAHRTEFKRKIKQKIDEVRQYIRPHEGTYNFALMVIPSEAVYYEIIASKDFVDDGGLFPYARDQNVFLVSPLTFWAYLTVIAHGLNGLQIERRSAEILASLQVLASKI